MSIFQFVREKVEQSTSIIKMTHGVSSNVHSTISGYPNIVGQAWIGGDADSFAEKVVTKLLPAIAELIAAIAGFNLNLSDVTSGVDAADQKIQGMASQIGDVFSGI